MVSGIVIISQFLGDFWQGQGSSLVPRASANAYGMKRHAVEEREMVIAVTVIPATVMRWHDPSDIPLVYPYLQRLD